MNLCLDYKLIKKTKVRNDSRTHFLRRVKGARERCVFLDDINDRLGYSKLKSKTALQRCLAQQQQLPIVWMLLGNELGTVKMAGNFD